MVEKSQFSPNWYRVADLRPLLKSQLAIHRHQFRSEIWYVLQDYSSGRYHRFSPAAYALIGLMDGKRTMREIWRQTAVTLGRDLPTQEEVIQLLAQLHQADALQSGVPPDIVELAERASKHRRRAVLQRIQNPMAIRIPLFDPDRFLRLSFHLVRPLFSAVGLLLWIAVTIWAIITAASHWDALTENIVDRVMSAENLLLILICYPVIKGIHELGHGYAIKRWDGEVHEMGIMFLVFMPVPYVEASASVAFPSKWQRALVAGAGIMVEVLIAAIALVVWLHVEPGLVRTVAFNAMLIAGVSTVLFNGNPLLRFDGYFVLADLLEIPNLGNRSNRHLFYLIQRYIFGAQTAESPASAPGERFWFVFYGLAALAYRLFIMTVIVMFVAGKFFFIGVLLALWAIGIMIVLPVAKGAWFLFTNPRLEAVRGRAIGSTVLVLGSAAAALAYVPLPHSTVAEGVVWVPERAVVHAAEAGAIERITARPNSQVAPGDTLIELDDPILETQLSIAQSRADEVRLRLAAIDTTDRVEAARLRERQEHIDRELERLLERRAGLRIASAASGRFVLPESDNLPGRYVARGQALGYVFDNSAPVVRVAVSSAEIDLVRQRTQTVEARLPGQLDKILNASVRSETPGATRNVPSPVLATVGGGKFALDPTAQEELVALEPLFYIDVELAEPLEHTAIGGRVYVRFDLGREAAAYRVYRTLRQIFLSNFRV